MKSMKKILIFAMLFMTTAVVMAQGLLNRPGMRRFGNRNHTRNQSAEQPAVQPAAAPAGAAGEAGAAEPGGRSIEFNATPVDLVFKVYGELVNKTILKDPQVPAATITLQPRQGQELSDQDKIEAIETVLEMNGIHMEAYGEKFMRALPRKEARKEGIPLFLDPDQEFGESTKVVSFMLKFQNIGVEDAQKALEGFKSASGILLVFERTNAILITDTEQNINRMREIAKEIDIANPVTEVVEYIQIKNANATEIKQVIDSIVQESQKEQEANGNKNKTAVQQQPPQQPRALLGGLRRPGQQQQPQAPVNNESMFIGVSEADRGMIRGKVVTIADERSNKILIITSATNMKFFKEVIAALDVETTPDTVVKVYRLKYAEAEDVSDMINDLIGNSVSGKDSKGNQNQNAKKGTSGSVTRNTQQANRQPANQRTGETKAGELNKDNTTVLADKRINGLVVMTQKELVPTIEQIIESMDIKLSQVLIETVIIEVTLGNGIETGMDWVQKGRQAGQQQAQNSLGQNLFYKTRTTTYTDKNGNTRKSTSVLSDLVPEGYSYSSTSKGDDGSTTLIEEGFSAVKGMVPFVDRSGLMNNWAGASSVGLAGGANSGSAAFGIASGITSNVFGKAFNFIFDSDELGLSAILQASESDSHSKYVASPVVMTLDNKEAVVNATRMKYLLKGFTSSGNSYSTIAVPDYEQKELGIEIKVTPKINPNGTVMLTVEEKYTQVGADQTIQYASSNGGGDSGGALQPVQVPTTITREMSADVLLENNQTVVFGGLTETQTSESETGIPILKDIPIIGKWLFGSVKQSEDRVELLVFMTPYVLDDAQAAQAEAIRRKKTMSDPRPWEDHGWSLSPLADPVAKKEQMRRIKEEWKKQDEERKTKIAIEKMKVERAEALKKMSKEERDLWLKMHKKELDDEHQDELEEKMLDKDSQEELKKLAAEIKAKKLGEANKAIDKAAAETAAENERGMLDAEKKAKESSQRILESADKELQKLEAPAIGGK